jgi:hypothetical protein
MSHFSDCRKIVRARGNPSISRRDKGLRGAGTRVPQRGPQAAFAAGRAGADGTPDVPWRIPEIDESLT